MKMARKGNEEKKISVLSKIRESKEVLFGAFSNELTKSAKNEKWKEVFQLASSLNLIPKNKEWNYVRDVLWQNLKKTAIAKVDNARKTGTGGGPNAKLTPIDDLVLDILGRESEVITGLGVTESLNDFNPPNINPSKTLGFGKSESINYSVTPNIEPSTNSKRPSQTIGKKKPCKSDEESQLALKKLKLSVHHLELVNYKTRLEILALERQLKLPPSTFTKSLSDGSSANLEEAFEDMNVVPFSKY